MERQSEIRKAFNSFLSKPSPLEPPPPPAQPPRRPLPRLLDERPMSKGQLTGPQWAVLKDLQDSLRRHGIDAELEEIGNGILDALAARPSLCRGLLAAYFLDV